MILKVSILVASQEQLRPYAHDWHAAPDSTLVDFSVDFVGSKITNKTNPLFEIAYIEC